MRTHASVVPAALLIAALLAAACASTSAGPPEETAPRIVALLDAGQVADADALFAAADDDREPLYPLLFEIARTRYEQGETARTTAVLRFMGRHYTTSLAVQEALAYALFLERAESDRARPELVREIDETLEKLGPRETPWIELVRAQNAIDRGDLDEARAAYARFGERQPDTSVELAVYVEDIDRYLKSH